MTATCTHSIGKDCPALYLAFELGLNEWKLGFTTGPAVPARLRSIGGGNLQRLLVEIVQAKKKFGLPADAPVRSCYEAGRDGFWLHRWLCEHGIDNIIVDSASIEVNRRSRRRKTDRLDAAKLVVMLFRHHTGEKVWSVVCVPSPEDEDRRQLHRDLEEMKAQRTQHINRIKGLLHGVGARLAQVNGKFPQVLARLRTDDDRPIPPALRERLLREFERFRFVQEQIRTLERQRTKEVRRGDGQPHVEKVRKLMCVRGVGLHSAWVLVAELFGWRRIRNRRQLASLVGLTPTPYNTGESEREQGISKAGNRRLRTLLIQLAWGWLHYQPGSALSRWYRQRFGKGGVRQRKIGIVALARKLLVALWKFLERDEAPEGARLVDWKRKLAGSGGERAAREAIAS
jgi:transposase